MAKFCWWCGRKLQGNHYKEIEYQDHKRICHKWCAKALKERREDDFVIRDGQILAEQSYNPTLD